MSLRIVARDDAEADIAEATLWYERQCAGLGREFVRAVDACFKLIAQQPHVLPVLHRGAHLGLLRNFPYFVINRVFPEFISVVAVIHGRRHPRRWKSRLTRSAFSSQHFSFLFRAAGALPWRDKVRLCIAAAR